MTGPNGHPGPHIDKRDFDANRPLLQDDDEGTYNEERSPRLSRSGAASHRSRLSTGSRPSRQSDDGLLSDVVEGIVERDRRKMQKEVIRVISFAWGVITWYVHLVACLGFFGTDSLVLQSGCG